MVRKAKLTTDQRRVAEEIASWPQSDGLPRDEVDIVATLVREVSVPTNWTFISENTPGDSCYLLVRGKAAITVDRHPIEVVGPGAVIGEMALINGRLRSASVVALEPCSLLHITADAFEQMRQRCPHMTERWLAYAARRTVPLVRPRTPADAATDVAVEPAG